MIFFSLINAIYDWIYQVFQKCCPLLKKKKILQILWLKILFWTLGKNWKFFVIQEQSHKVINFILFKTSFTFHFHLLL